MEGNPKLLTEPDELRDFRGRIVDARAPDRFARGHIPGASNLPAASVTREEGDIQYVTGPERIARAAGQTGIDHDAPVAVYGEGAQLEAAYLFWALEHVGHERVSLLDGGLSAWLAAGGALATEAPPPEPTRFRPKPHRNRRMTCEALQGRLRDEMLCALDARSELEYRLGRLPGAAWLPWETLLRTDGRFRSLGALRETFAEAGLDGHTTAVSYCGHGVRAALVYVGLRLIGHPDARLYDGSWAEWGSRPELPRERG